MTKKKESTGQKRRNEFPKGKRLYDLVKKEYRSELRELVENLRQWLIDGENTDWRKIKRIDIDYSKIKYSRRCKGENKIIKHEFFEIISDFLIRIGRSKGLNVPLEAFFRYLASPKHSNFGMKIVSLTSLFHKQLAYLESKNKVVEDKRKKKVKIIKQEYNIRKLIVPLHSKIFNNTKTNLIYGDFIK